jgi:phage N-6-adenine-methyltransferase
MNNSLLSSKSNEWETPPHIFDILHAEFCFELDAAATTENNLCDNFYTKDDNSLIQDWSKYKVVFCNPPYGRLIGKFIQKGYKESLKGTVCVFLIPARVDTKWWHEYCIKGEIRFIKGRLKFSQSKVPAPFPSAIVVFDKNIKPNTKYIKI